MATVAELQATADQLVADNAALKTAVEASFARVEALLNALPTSGIDPVLLDPIVAQLQTIHTGLGAVIAEADAERPAPVPAPPAV